MDGQGSILELKIEDGWYAGLGMAFIVPVAGLDFRIKPSVDYYQQRVSLDGEVVNARCQPLTPGASNCRRLPNDTLIGQQVAGSDDGTFGAIGPRLAIEYDAIERGGLTASLFVEGYAFWTLGDRNLDFSSSSTCQKNWDDPAPTTCFADFSYEKDAVAGGAGVGVRLRWHGR